MCTKTNSKATIIKANLRLIASDGNFVCSQICKNLTGNEQSKASPKKRKDKNKMIKWDNYKARLHISWSSYVNESFMDGHLEIE